MAKFIASTFTVDGETFYPGEFDPARSWNGFACPRFTADTALQIAQDQILESGGKCVYSEPDGAISIRFPGDEEADVIAPDPEGFYWVGAWSWTWVSADSAQCCMSVAS